MRNYFISAVVLAAVLAAPAVNAATITSGPAIGLGANPPAISFSVGDTVIFTDFYDISEASVTFTFTALEDLKFTNISVSGQGLQSNLSQVSFSFDNGAPGPSGYTNYVTVGSTIGSAFFNDFAMVANETVNLTFVVADPNAISAGFQIGLYGEAVAPIPVPAALPLMLGALGGLGGLASLRARKSKS